MKQQLAGVRMLFDWPITGKVVPLNPASAVSGTKLVVNTGKTPPPAQWRRLLIIVFWVTRITAYLANGGALEHAQAMAAHASPHTTRLYDRAKERLAQDEVERIRL